MVINNFQQHHKQQVLYTVQLVSTLVCSTAFKDVFSSSHLLGPLLYASEMTIHRTLTKLFAGVSSEYLLTHIESKNQ